MQAIDRAWPTERSLDGRGVERMHVALQQLHVRPTSRARSRRCFREHAFGKIDAEQRALGTDARRNLVEALPGAAR